MTNMKNHKFFGGGGKKRNNRLGFTLAEVLITLVIIGVVAAITVPSLLVSTQEKEFHSALRKNISVIQNAFNLAQVEEGMMGDNSAIVASAALKSTFDIAAGWGIIYGLSKYVNTNKYCTSMQSNPVQMCEETEIEELKERWTTTQKQRGYIWLSDGSIYGIHGTFGYSIILDRDKPLESECAYIYIDVNGDKGPNKWGKDLYLVYVTKNKIKVFDNADLEPSEKMKKILLNAK